MGVIQWNCVSRLERRGEHKPASSMAREAVRTLVSYQPEWVVMETCLAR
jgi:hypothetical protein